MFYICSITLKDHKFIYKIKKASSIKQQHDDDDDGYGGGYKEQFRKAVHWGTDAVLLYRRQSGPSRFPGL